MEEIEQLKKRLDSNKYFFKVDRNYNQYSRTYYNTMKIYVVI